MRKVFQRASKVFIDVFVLSFALWAAFFLRFEGQIPFDMLRRAFIIWPYVVTFQYLVLAGFRVPRFSWRYIGLREVVRIGVALGVASVVLLTIRLSLRPFPDYYPPLRHALIPIGVISIDLVLAFVGVAGVRAARRLMGERADETPAPAARVRVPTILVGAGRAGVIMVRELERRKDLGVLPLGFVDDDPDKAGTVVHGVPVLGPTERLPAFAEELGAQQVLITIAAASGRDIRRITSICEKAGLQAKIVPAITELVEGKVSLSRIREVNITDLLRRDAVELDDEAISGYVRGRRVLVTGAGGSIGSELCRQLYRFGPAKLLLVERAENALFKIHRELRAFDRPEGVDHEIEVVPVVCDVTDHERVRAVFEAHRPHLVLHAAAHKHVPMMEWNACEAIKNNVGGTRNVATAAAAAGVEAFVMISTDKAVRPTSVMGASKRSAELLVQGLDRDPEIQTRYVSVRFGNVLGSQGSVVPIFEEQIARGGPVTVTHPDMCRYFMTIPEASQLVLQAGTMGQGGEVFILDMGEPVKIVDLARDLIHLSGLRPDEDIDIEFTGVRPGEKLFEELSCHGELRDTAHPDILLEVDGAPDDDLDERLRALEAVALQGDDEAVRTALRTVVPEFAPPA